jgi:hypothetical protein
MKCSQLPVPNVVQVFFFCSSVYTMMVNVHKAGSHVARIIPICSTPHYNKPACVYFMYNDPKREVPVLEFGKVMRYISQTSSTSFAILRTNDLYICIPNLNYLIGCF